MYRPCDVTKYIRNTVICMISICQIWIYFLLVTFFISWLYYYILHFVWQCYTRSRGLVRPILNIYAMSRGHQIQTLYDILSMSWCCFTLNQSFETLTKRKTLCFDLLFPYIEPPLCPVKDEIWKNMWWFQFKFDLCHLDTSHSVIHHFK